MSGGKRAAARPKPRFRPALLVLAVGITLCLVAWGYLVYVAIDFGAEARRGTDETAWTYLAVAGIGAVACLFLGFLLISRLSRAIGLTSPPPPKQSKQSMKSDQPEALDSSPGNRAAH